jgi:hypothetical protein
VKPIDWGGILAPYLQPVKERLNMLPLAQYEDGSVRASWPGMLTEALSKGMAAAETPIPAIDDDQAWADKSAAMFDVTSLAPMAGAGVAMTGALDNAVGSAGGRLAKGTDLPMDLASRMARAKEMGFDTDKTWYRGTTANEVEARPNTWAALDPNYANGFAGQGDGANVMPLLLRSQNFAPAEMGLSPEVAKRAGFEGRMFGDGTAQIFDPRNIRSVNAAFDPARSDSANLLAANAKQGAAVPLAIDAAERQPQTLTTANIIKFLRGQQ